MCFNYFKHRFEIEDLANIFYLEAYGNQFKRNSIMEQEFSNEDYDRMQNHWQKTKKILQSVSAETYVLAIDSLL